MIVALITVMFLAPAYYTATSKGYHIGLILTAIAILSMGIPIIMDLSHQADVSIPDSDIPYLSSLWVIIFPALAWGMVRLLPARESAPGQDYLEITFECPECRGEVTCHRSKEGQAELCPGCGEMIRVPLDEFSPEPIEHTREKPAITSGWVCFDSFSDEMCALQLHALLEEYGIESEVVGETGSGALPQLGGTHGFKVVIDINDWDQAVEIEEAAAEEVDLSVNPLVEERPLLREAAKRDARKVTETGSRLKGGHMHQLQNELNKSVSWFYWIGGLSIVNTLIIQFNGEVSFIVGLGITQFFDGIAWALEEEAAVGHWIRHVTLGINIVISLGFCLFGIAGKKLYKGIYLFGLILYGLDALLFLAVADYFSFGFHVFALYFLIKGIGTMNRIKASINTPEVPDTAPLGGANPERAPMQDHPG